MDGNLCSPCNYPREITEQVAEQGKVQSFLLIKLLWQTSPHPDHEQTENNSEVQVDRDEMNERATLREPILIHVLIHQLIDCRW